MNYLADAITWIILGALVGAAIRPLINQIAGADNDRIR